MLSSEENAGTVSECLPEMFVVHSPVDGSITDETSEHSQSQSKNVTVISTSDDRKGNDEKKSGSSARAVREKGSAKNRAISTPRPLQKIEKKCQNLTKNSQNFDRKIEIRKRCKGVHCVDLGESFPTSIYLQNLASIQPRTSLLKFEGGGFSAPVIRTPLQQQTEPTTSLSSRQQQAELLVL